MSLMSLSVSSGVSKHEESGLSINPIKGLRTPVKGKNHQDHQKRVQRGSRSSLCLNSVNVERSHSDTSHEQSSTNSDSQKIRKTPPVTQERMFLQFEPPLFMGRVDSESDPTSNLPTVTQLCGHLRQLNGITLTELAQKFHTHSGLFLTSEVNRLLDQLFPPQELVFENHKWRSEVSKTPSPAIDRLKIFEKFDSECEMLTEHSGTNNPVMTVAVLDELIQELFDECLRQEITENPQLGIILVNLRNGFGRIQHTLKSLIENAMLQAMRLDSVLGEEVREEGKRLEKEKKDLRKLEAELQRLEMDYDKTEELLANQRSEAQDKNQGVLEYLENFCVQAQAVIKGVEYPDVTNNSSNKKVKKGHSVVPTNTSEGSALTKVTSEH